MNSLIISKQYLLIVNKSSDLPFNELLFKLDLNNCFTAS